MSRIFRLQKERGVASKLPEVFSFFSDAHNLQRLIPPWVSFRILNPSPVLMRPGTLIDYEMRMHGIPLSWQTEITVWELPFRFVDEKRKGPYCFWKHEHRFKEREGEF